MLKCWWIFERKPTGVGCDFWLPKGRSFPRKNPCVNYYPAFSSWLIVEEPDSSVHRWQHKIVKPLENQPHNLPWGPIMILSVLDFQILSQNESISVIFIFMWTDIICLTADQEIWFTILRLSFGITLLYARRLRVNNQISVTKLH